MEIDQVQFTTGEIAQLLGIAEQQVRILAQRLEISAPYTQGQVDAIQLELERMAGGSGIITPAQVSPAPTPTEAIVGELSPAMTAFCDALEGQIIDSLRTEMVRRLPGIRAAVVDSLLQK
jgi:hypothetical protein